MAVKAGVALPDVPAGVVFALVFIVHFGLSVCVAVGTAKVNKRRCCVAVVALSVAFVGDHALVVVVYSTPRFNGVAA
jgi:hypothetical protein